MKYAVVVEKTNNTYSAYVPDLPGCIATAKTRPGVLSRIRQAIQLHIEGLLEDGHKVPRPRASVDHVEA